VCREGLERGGRFQRKGLVVVVDVVNVRLERGPLGNLSKHLIEDVVGHVDGQQVEDKAVGGGQVEVLQPPGFHLAHQDGPGEVGDTDPSSPVDESENGQDGQTQPPEPQDEEVLLVEQVVGQDAQVVGPVDTTRGSSNTDVAGNLSREEFTHGVVGEVLSVLAHMLHRPDVVQHLLSVAPELVQ